MTATVKDVLIKARELIADEKRWSNKGWGIANGRICAAHACAIANGTGKACDGGEAQKTLQRIAGCYLGEFNDAHTHAEVLQLFDRAIAAQESAS